jgi:hypothetical protein
VCSIKLEFRSKILLIIIFEAFTRSSNSRYMIMMYSICWRLLNIMDSQETAYRTYRVSLIQLREMTVVKGKISHISATHHSIKSISVGGSPALSSVCCFQYVPAYFFVNLAGFTKIEC